MTRPKRPASGGAQPVEHNLQRSVGAARSLTLAVSGVQKGMGDAAGAAGILAENIAKASGNAKVASGALGIGAIVSVGLELVQIWKAATEQMKAFNSQLNQVGGDTKVLQLSGISYAKDLQAQRQQIINAGEKELNLAEQIANEDEKKVQRAAIYKKVREGIAALDRQTIRERNLSYATTTLALSSEVELNALKIAMARSGWGGTRHEAYTVGAKQIELNKTSEIESYNQTAAEKHYNPAQIEHDTQLIKDKYSQQLDLLKLTLDQEAQKVGDSFTESLAGGIADGISQAIQTGDIGAGFKAMTGGILIGLGEMMQTVGTHSLVAAKLMASILKALSDFAPEGAIGPALLLIAAGGVLKGLGASMGGHKGGGGGSGGSAGYGGYGGSTSYVGVLNPTGAPNIAGLAPASPVTVHATFIGKDDPRAQRELLEMISRAQRRGTTNG